MRLRVSYRRPGDLVADHDQQFKRSGLLVRTPPPPGVELYQDVDLELVMPDGSVIETKGQIVQVAPGIGIAVAFQPQKLAGLAEAVEAARAAGDVAGEPAEHAIVGAQTPPAIAPSAAPSLERISAAPEVPPPEAPASAPARVAVASQGEKIQQAMHGTRDERAAILRDVTKKSLHGYVLRNPNIQLDEVSAIAKMATVSPEALLAIAERREWAQRSEIALALVRNPKMPPPAAIKLLAYVSMTDLRQLAKDPHTRAPIQAAARKRVLG